MVAPEVPFAARVLGWVLTLGGGIGALAALTLIIERFNLLVDPTYRPTCSINPILSCGSVMTTSQAAVFGFPNPLIGVVGFSVVTTIGVAALTGARLPRWFWLGLQAGATFGVVFVHWLIYQSLYRIGALCPYCMVVWVVTIVIFWYLTLHNLHHRHLPTPAVLRGAVTGLVRYHTVGLLLWFLVIAALVGEQFWFYWRTLLT
ncbi:vitamin K epoxide reductase family protein [Micromonospora sp. WMMA1923]|uniref:vitamin K epoxide reductase family protein n=1 Tax=Micromonospora sp. WMMA1923 TaxID=3404125 RepID=UPI003B93F0AB